MPRLTKQPLRAILAANFNRVRGDASVLQVADDARKRCPDAAVDTKTLNNLKTAGADPKGKKKPSGPTVAALEAASIGLQTPAWLFLLEEMPADPAKRAELTLIVNAYLRAQEGGQETLVGIAKSVAHLTEITDSVEQQAAGRVQRHRPGA